MEPFLSMPYLPNLNDNSERRPIGSVGSRPAPERGFRDRRAAGRELAHDLAGYVGRSGVYVLALSCGGVPVACEIARALGAPMDAFLGCEPVGPLPDVQDRTVILVDDGLAPAARVKDAVAALRKIRPEHIVVALPAVAPETCAEVSSAADEFVCARTPGPFYAAGLWYLWYQDPTPTSDEEVRDLLANFAPRATDRAAGSMPASRVQPNREAVQSIEVQQTLRGMSAEPPSATGNQVDSGHSPTR